ncbi:MAG: DUF4434 domain-containing protein [Crocinitomicaceae bacterium]|nr:DUF4434 domain-containing protein [Crocinitomicaceae bacterium]
MKLSLHKSKLSTFAIYAFLFVLLAPICRASETLFYQPLRRDSRISSSDWSYVWREAYRNQYRTVIIQWTQFGDFLIDQEAWLLTSLQIAQQEGLDLIVGLYADPSFSQTILQAGWEDRFEEYWTSLQRRSLSLHSKLLPLLKEREIEVIGWYFPSELSDRLFTTIGRRRFTQNQLQLLSQRLNKPLHISAYNLGYLSPKANATWLSGLQDIGLHVWWQDGAGVKDLSEPALQAYFNQLPCDVGIVREAFIQSSSSENTFRAEYLPPKEYDSCHLTGVFSLRYMPWLQSIPAFKVKGQ